MHPNFIKAASALIVLLTSTATATVPSHPAECGRSMCPDDQFLTNHSCSGAASIGNSGIMLLEADLVVSDAEADYFRIPYKVGYELYVRADFTHTEGDIDLLVFRDDMCDVGPGAASSLGTGNSEELRLSSQFDYTLKVFRNGGSMPCSEYQLTVILAFTPSNLGATVCLANINSTGSFACFGASGSAQVSDNNLQLDAYDMPRNSVGFFLNSPGVGFSTAPGSQGYLCINNGGVGRFSRPGEILSTGPLGFFSLDVDLTDIPRPTGVEQIQPGESWAFQSWFRDTTSTGQPTSNFSSAVMVWFD